MPAPAPVPASHTPTPTSFTLVPSHADARSDDRQRGSASLLIPARWVPLVRVGLVMLLLLVAWVGIIEQDQLRPSLDYLDSDPDGMVRAAVLRAGLADLGLSPWFIAWFLVVVGGVQLVINYAMALLLVWRRPRDVIVLVISVFLLASTCPTYPPDLPALRGSEPWHGYAATLLTYLFICSFYLLVLLFPSGRFVPRWLVVPAVAFVLFEAWAFFIVPEDQTMGNVGPDVLLLATLLLTGVIGQVYRYRRVSGVVEREQTRVFAFGIGLAMTVFVALNIFLSVANLDRPDYPAVRGVIISMVFELLFSGLFLLATAALVVSVLRYRLFSIDIVINRTLVYVALTACVVGLYVLVVGGLGALLQTDSGGLAAFAAAGVIAIAFQPLRARLQRGVNRLLYGQRDEPYAVLSGLSRTLETTLAPAAVLPTIVQTVAEALHLPYVAIRLHREADAMGQIAAEAGTPGPIALELPLLYQGADVGSLQVAARAGDNSIAARDGALLEDLARQVGVAVHAVRLTSDLQRSRERIVTAREEELRRLRRDLHDGLGPRLASMTLRIETARDRLAHDPLADDLLGDLSERMEEAVIDIRRLVYGLRPPALDDLGVVGAVRQIAGSFDSSGVALQLDVPDALPPLSAAAEAAAFRITQEALTNVVRHARASRCTISLTANPAATLLTVSISDDGDGIDPSERRGIGLRAMRERAEELGGSLEVDSEPGVGTRVTAVLPCQWTDDHGVDTSATPDAGAAPGDVK